ncbi:MAG: hypothetical protein U0263_36545 [Polyangiaceae bacterium]
MPSPTPQELKKLLIAEGLEIYRTLTDRVVLADRVRDNLIMDSGVCVTSAEAGLGIRVVFRAQACDFQGETPDGLFGHARRLGQPGAGLGYSETGTSVVPIHDPGDKSRVLDTWYEVSFERLIGDPSDLIPELRTVLSWPKVATRGGT